MNRVLISCLAVPALAVALSGCAIFPRSARWVDFKSIETASDASYSRQDGYYSSAVSAISRRDYAGALDFLQTARAHDPGDVRILNAFGVVYDKLGRFDLSARYYAEAAQIDPSSWIVARNRAYSTNLQAATAVPLLAEAAPPRPPAAAVNTAWAPRPAVIRLALAPQPVQLAAVKPAPGLAGRPLEIADLSGRPAGAEPVRVALRRLGWTVGAVASVPGRPQARSEIVYSEQSAVVAHALQRTLPGAVRLTRCEDGCKGIRLAVGVDAVAWFSPARAGQVLGGD